MKNLMVIMILTGLIVFAIFSVLRPLLAHLIPNFYPLPFTAVATGLAIIGLSYIGGHTWQMACASHDAALGWLALAMAIVVDHTCPAGFLGFLSLACLLSIRYLTTMRLSVYTDIRTDTTGIAQVVLLQVGIDLFLFATIWGIYAPAH